MKIVGLIPFWKNKASNRDLKQLAGKYLIEYTIKLLNQSEVDETIIYSSSKDVLDFIDNDLKVSVIQRSQTLDNEEIKIEEILNYFIKDVDCDIVVYINPYSPFLTQNTLSTCINKVKSESFDSACTVKEYKKLAWFQGKPINFSLDTLTPKLIDVEPIIFEQGLLYVINVKAFKENQYRIGKNPYFSVIDNFEGHEINNINDFEVAELIINSGMFKSI